jgi:hypothetical protein
MDIHLHDPLSLLLIFLLALLAAVLVLFALLLLQRTAGCYGHSTPRGEKRP